MRLAAVILPDLGTGPDVPIVVSHWFVARGDRVWEGERLVEVLVGPGHVRRFLAGFRTLGRDPWSGRRSSRGGVGARPGCDDRGRRADDVATTSVDCQRGRRGEEPPSSRPTT